MKVVHVIIFQAIYKILALKSYYVRDEVNHWE